MSHFILCNETNDVTHTFELYFREVARLHGIPRLIISNEILSFLVIFELHCGGSWLLNLSIVPLAIHELTGKLRLQIKP